jgi:hypothetical protein
MNELRSDTRVTVTVTVGDLEIESTESIVVRLERVCGGVAGLASKQPVSIVVRSPAGTWRLDLPSEPAVSSVASAILVSSTADRADPVRCPCPSGSG